MLEGKGISGVGGSFKPSEILKDHWQEHLEMSGTKWIVPFCEDVEKNGDILDIESVLIRYKFLHKKERKRPTIDLVVK